MNSVGEIREEESDGKSQTSSSSVSGETSNDSGGETVSSGDIVSGETTTDSGGERVAEHHDQIIYEPMTPVGGFREGEINGKPFHKFNFLSETETPSTDDFPPLFVCPSFRWSDEWIDLKSNNPDGNDFVPVDDFPYPYMFNKRSGDQQFQFLIGSNVYNHTCKLPLLPLFKECMPDDDDGFLCGLCYSSLIGTGYYICATCDREYHKECIESPLQIQHPSYPFRSLKLHHYYPSSEASIHKYPCFCCQEIIIQNLYYCPTNKLIMHPVCAMKPIPIFIDHPKRHLHPLTFFPKQNFLPCDICGLIKEHFPTYVCARCVFVVHQDCIYHPYVIRISRHHHRISFISSHPPGKWFCGVCRRKVDHNYGAYSCNKCDGYFVHTKCALRRDLWDGKELEGIPEKPEIIVEPFQRISDGIILHFAHGHHMRLWISGAYDEGKFCQACILPIYEGSYYLCMDQCDFILHEACANAPRKKQHALCARPLTLKVGNMKYSDDFFCNACCRLSCGFLYEGYKEEICFELDFRCASVSEPFQYEGHKHPLFLALTPEEEKSAICQVCQEEGDEYNDRGKLACIDCNYIICFRCATLPYKARYKHDEHFLIFRKKEIYRTRQGWCDICESKIVYSRKGGFYSCDDYCSTTVHVDCLLGKHPYLKPGQIKNQGQDVLILHNKTMSRPLCHGTKHRCQDKIVFKKRNETFCSFSCLEEF
ncbi:unnamed protein product [Thlaspi arvense]|uniref:Zinc finger PHD-type domain-containing protein n=1 Tax=Thlaspi arvense TaxID=13288 RepID=A0AAU9T3C2_THLAR|nr:unnamed protein product [Thlaspi arvense]